MEEENTGTLHKPPQKEDDVSMLQDMLERLLHGYLESNRRARVMIDTMLDELREEGVRKYLPKLRSHQEENYQARHKVTDRDITTRLV